MQWEWTHQVSNLSTSFRLDQYVLEMMNQGEGTWKSPPPEILKDGISRSQIQKWIRSGELTINGLPGKTGYSVEPGDEISLITTQENAPLGSLQAIPGRLNILFEDNDLIIINKVQGLSVHPSGTESGPTLCHYLLHHFSGLITIGDPARPGIVHRLDKNTSGAMVIAKSQLAHKRLSEKFAKHEIKREYLSLCYGTLKKELLKVETLIGRNPNDRVRMSSKVRTGRKAISHFQILKNFKMNSQTGVFASIIQSRLETGRTHQIRVHLTDLGCSIMGDPLYGAPSENQDKWTRLPDSIQNLIRKLPGQALHSSTIDFEHPISGKRMTLKAEPPQAFQNLQSELDPYVQD